MPRHHRNENNYIDWQVYRFRTFTYALSDNTLIVMWYRTIREEYNEETQGQQVQTEKLLQQ